MMSRIQSFLLFGLLAFALSGSLPAAAAGCLSAGEARAAVAAGLALRLGDLRQAVPGDIVGAQLCKDKGQLIYRLGVMSVNGKIKKLSLDALSGNIMK